MASKIPFMTGVQSTCAFFIGPTKREIATKTWSITRDVTKINDGVNGEDRDRLDAITNFYDIALEVYAPDAKMVKAFIEDQANDDSGVAPLEKAFSVKLKPRDGTKSGFVCTEVVLGDWKIASSGRTDRLMVTIPLRARYVKSAAV